MCFIVNRASLSKSQGRSVRLRGWHSVKYFVFISCLVLEITFGTNDVISEY